MRGIWASGLGSLASAVAISCSGTGGVQHSHLPHNGPIPTLRIPEMSITRHRPTSTTTRYRDGTRRNHTPKAQTTQDHTIASPSRPRRRGTYRTYQVVPRTLLQPSRLYQSSRMVLCVFLSECRTRSYLATGKPGVLLLAAGYGYAVLHALGVPCHRPRNTPSSCGENDFQPPVPTRNGFSTHLLTYASISPSVFT